MNKNNNQEIIFGKCTICGGPLTTWHYFLKHSKKEDKIVNEKLVKHSTSSL